MLYFVVVGVRTANASEFVEGNPINGIINLQQLTTYVLSYINFYLHV